MWDLDTIKKLNRRQKKTKRAARSIYDPDQDPGLRSAAELSAPDIVRIGDLVKFNYSPSGREDVGFVMEENGGEVTLVNTSHGPEYLGPNESRTVRKAELKG